MTPEPERLAAYLGGLFAREDAALAAVREGHRDADLPLIHVSPEEGAILRVLIRLVGARRVLEVGTLSGYSGIWIARGLPPGAPRDDRGRRAARRPRAGRISTAPGWPTAELLCGEAPDTTET
jgi:hypothetical protein